MKPLFKLLIIVSFLVLGTAALSACNTVEGFGYDMNAFGDWVKSTSRDSRGY